MKVTFLTLGSRGDVQPYVALAKELIKNGHEALVCTGGSFRNFIKQNEVEFYEASADLMAILESKEGRKVFNGGNYNIFKIMKYAKEVITPAYRKSLSDFLEASKGSDVIVYHPKALGAADIAEYLRIPCISMPPVPILYPITEFPNFAISSTRNLGYTLNKLTYKATALAEFSYMKDINEFRKNSLKLPKRKAGEVTFQVRSRDIPIIYPISPYMFKEVKSWKDRVFVSGFFFMDMGEAKLNEKLEDFIAKDKKPIVVSFSSMPLKNPEIFKEKLIKALKETENRAVVLTGTSGMNFDNDESIFAVKKAPHRLIFKQAKGIVHHGGVGTMSEALLSGAPQLIMPFTTDQPFWAHILYSKGYTMKPLKEKNLEVSELVKALKNMGNAKYIEKAKDIQGVIEKENGLQNAVKYIEKVYESYK
ncbi:glycosyltransferase [Alkaliphilus sp. MSJ-5]|uniref:Glycosyltransferase n=1 Tax=Alkaliphilus flagellatus TaxID=2841507 RepID=A0ABS6G1L0_9FIRM|nr:glycosyltransferase [Alkaliphilus flagellatus]MBU5676370.1 glycosyltransferase [Alkaliphilus flagellatus]